MKPLFKAYVLRVQQSIVIMLYVVVYFVTGMSLYERPTAIRPLSCVSLQKEPRHKLKVEL